MEDLRIWLVRHGESTWNASGRMQGWADPPLSEDGRWQAARLALRFGQHTLAGIISSPLDRARQTAEAIAAVAGLDVLVDERLKEHGMGEAQGLTWEDMVGRWPELPDVEARGISIRAHVPGAESLPGFKVRVQEAFAAICRDFYTGDVVVVGHGGTFRAYLGMILNVADSYSPNLRFGNASVSLVEIRPRGRPAVHFVNDVSHLLPADTWMD
ncbi:MAG: histidine phosphatase family protein [Anaerolineae bacterium]|nr:histidine phosphatase family protein [Anaerolineae bacterium]